MLTFGHSMLEPGECYKLSIDEEFVGIRNNVGEAEVCMSKCICNVKGIDSCN